MKSENKEQLVIDYLLGECSEEEKKVVKHRIDEEPDMKELYIQYKDIILAGDIALSNKFDDLNENKLIGLSKKITDKNDSKRKLIYRYLTAASIAIVFAAGIIFYTLHRNQSPQEIFTEYTVPVGGKGEIVLIDGTIVCLNACSKLKYSSQYGTMSRIVYLEGEGYFDVAKNKDLPFMVKTKHICVKAIGTKFDVKAYSDENKIETVLVEGKVKIEKSKQSSIKGFNDGVILTSNQRITFFKENDNQNTYKIEVSDFDEADQFISWKDETWEIKSLPLEDLARQLERKYNVTVMFIDDELKQVKFTGKLRDEPVEQVLKAIELTAQVKVKIKGKIIEIRK